MGGWLISASALGWARTGHQLSTIRVHDVVSYCYVIILQHNDADMIRTSGHTRGWMYLGHIQRLNIFFGIFGPGSYTTIIPKSLLHCWGLVGGARSGNVRSPFIIIAFWCTSVHVFQSFEFNVCLSNLVTIIVIKYVMLLLYHHVVLRVRLITHILYQISSMWLTWGFHINMFTNSIPPLILPLLRVIQMDDAYVFWLGLWHTPP